MAKKQETVNIEQWREEESLPGDPIKKSWVVKVLSPFYLQVRKGPPEAIKVGDTVRLHDFDLVKMLFQADRIQPVEPGIPDEADYVFLAAHQAIVSGEYRDVTVADIATLTRAEAVPLLKTKTITPIYPEHFTLMRRN